MYSKFIKYMCLEFYTEDGKMKFYLQMAGKNAFRYVRWTEPGSRIRHMDCKFTTSNGKPYAIGKSGKTYEVTRGYLISKEEFYSRLDNIGVLSRDYYIHLFRINGKKYCIYSARITDLSGKSYYTRINDMPLANTPFAVEYIYSHRSSGDIIDFRITNGIDSYVKYSRVECSEEDFIMPFYT